MPHLRSILATALCAVAVTGHAREQHTNHDRSVFQNYRSLPANMQAQQATVKNVSGVFPGWHVTTDKLNGAFTDIFGKPVDASGSGNTQKAQSILSGQLSKLGIVPREWTFVSSQATANAGYVHYVRNISGHPVAFSRLSFRFTPGGDLSRIQAKNYGAPQAGLQPSISADAAKQAAIQDLGTATITSMNIDANWAWFPIPSASGYTLHPAWSFTVKGRIPGGLPLILTGYVDAITGTLLYRTDQVKETSWNLTVKGNVYPNGTLHPTAMEPLPDLGIAYGTDTIYTDTAGVDSTTTLALPLTATVPLSGKWSTVFDSVTGLMPIFTDALSVTGTTYAYPTTAPCSDRHVNAYYHVNRVHNFMKQKIPLFTGMDFSLPTNVDLTSGTCNAFYSGVDINFFAADATCNSFAEIGDIIYHEYGHGITDHMYTDITGSTIENSALNEATSDTWAFSITRNPILGQNAFVGYGGFIRRYDMTPQVYPVDLDASAFGDPHKNGQIICGTWVDLANNLGNVDSMVKIFTEVYYDVPDGPNGTEGTVYQSMLIDALFADDNNSDLSDGTPHYNQIVAAFAKHGIYLEGDAFLVHNELSDQPASLPIAVSAELSTSTSEFMKDLTLYYRLNGTGSWNPLPMSLSGLFYSATIPAQSKGTTVEYYFMIHDSLGVPNAFFPITCNPALPASETTIPYQFAVGVAGVDSNNFEGSTTGWSIGSNAGDDATAGIWFQTNPYPSSYYTQSFPGGDHTTGSGMCLLTGNGDIGAYGQTVGDGTTTTITPLFDISTFSTPVVSYYRWFSNEQGYENFKNDPWIVKVGNGSGTWATVEDTYQGDDNWRRRVFPVSTFLPAGTTHVQLKFFASDSTLSTWADNGQSYTVGGIDDFMVYDKDNVTAVPSLAQGMIDVFPNPADDKIHVTMPAGNNGTIKLYDLTGKEMGNVTVTPGCSAYSIPTNTIAAGVYYLVIQIGSSIQSKKIVVNHQ
jgi:Secretion system C-terminal sorting domain/Thermolysin metallopeptidase, catalytic domain